MEIMQFAQDFFSAISQTKNETNPNWTCLAIFYRASPAGVSRDPFCHAFCFFRASRTSSMTAFGIFSFSSISEGVIPLSRAEWIMTF